MLILSRKLLEKVVVDKNIIIQVIDIGAGRVRLGIEAPKETVILRQELLERGPVWFTRESE